MKSWLTNSRVARGCALFGVSLDDVGFHQGGDGKEPHDAVFEPPYRYTVEVPPSPEAAQPTRWRCEARTGEAAIFG